MFGYYLRLALKSFRRNPGLTAVMVCAIALGIAVCVVTITVYHAMSGNPIWWKNDRLYAVTMDLGDPTQPADPRHPDLPASQLSYRDATALFRSDIPLRKVIMATQSSVIAGGDAHAKPLPVSSRVTTADFFALFDVPFLYGAGWSARADQGSEPLIVLSRRLNERLFGGTNSIGRTIRLNDRPFRIVGVLDEWFPVPKFYDLNTGAFARPEDVYIPFGWASSSEQLPYGDIECWKAPVMSAYRDFLNSDCQWLQMWAELPDAAGRARMQGLLDGYWAEQHRTGRFLRPRNNRLTPVEQWLQEHDVVGNDDRILVGVAFAFLAICLVNTAGILLAKFLGRSGLNGIRRALGASRRDLFLQHLIEVGLLSSLGAVLGLALAAFGLSGVHALYANPVRGGYQELAHFDVSSIVAAVGLAVLSAAAAGLYPAWRIGRLAPATHLRNQ